MAIIANFAVLFEPSSRILDYIIFTLPRTIEGGWDLLEKLNVVKQFNGGIKLIFSISIAVAILLKQNGEENFPKSYSRMIEFIYGKSL